MSNNNNNTNNSQFEFNPQLCHFTIADMGNALNRNGANCICGQSAYLHPQQQSSRFQVVSLSDASINAIVHGVLNHAKASPISLTPATFVVKDAPHYMRMCERVVNHVYNKRNIVENYYLMDYKNGELVVHRGMSIDPPFHLVIPSAIEASNIYHLLKALNDEVPKWIEYLSRFGIPQLVEMVNTGTTPNYDGTGYHPDGLEPLE